MSNLRKATGGFTLVELLVTIAAGAIIIASLSSLTTNYLHLGQRGRFLSIANSFVESKFEELRNTGYNGIPLGTTSLTGSLSTQLPPSRSATMTVTSPYLGIKQVDITISYSDQGLSNSYGYTTYIGELGVGQ